MAVGNTWGEAQLDIQKPNSPHIRFWLNINAFFVFVRGSVSLFLDGRSYSSQEIIYKLCGTVTTSGNRKLSRSDNKVSGKMWPCLMN